MLVKIDTEKVGHHLCLVRYHDHINTPTKFGVNTFLLLLQCIWGLCVWPGDNHRGHECL